MLETCVQHYDESTGYGELGGSGGMGGICHIVYEILLYMLLRTLIRS